MLDKGVIGEKYNIGSNNEKMNIEVVKDICNILDKKIPSKNNYSNLIQFVDDRPGHDHRYALNNSKIKKIGWKPNYNWSDGLNETINWYLNNQDYLNKDSSMFYSGEDLEQLSKNTNILVTGGSGQVGSNLRNFKHKENLKFYFPESKVFNLLKKESMVSFLANNKIDLILNLAAYTEVDNSEKNKSLCREINLDGVITLSKIAKERDIGFIQISTDYVFGNNYKGIRNVNDEHNPVNYYGKTKSEAERFVLNISENILLLD